MQYKQISSSFFSSLKFQHGIRAWLDPAIQIGAVMKEEGQIRKEDRGAATTKHTTTTSQTIE